MSLAIVILAGGEGTRMRTRRPKVLHELAGEPMLRHILRALEPLRAQRTAIVVGYGADKVQEVIGEEYTYVYQERQLGTAHALLTARQAVEEAQTILVLYGDVPLIRGETLERLVSHHREQEADLTLLSCQVQEPGGYGRILRGPSGEVKRVVEEKQATPSEKEIQEVNAGFYCFQADWLWPPLERVPLGEQGEYYLTDIVEVAVGEGARVETVSVDDPEEILGINNRLHLAQAEGILRRRILERLMLEGVTILDPASTYVAAGVKVGIDTVIHPGTILEGDTTIGQDCIIGPYSLVRDSAVADGCRITHSVLEGATLEEGVDVGPFSHLRPGTYIETQVHIGNFAEVKNSRLGARTLMGHFSYVGDASVGRGVNISAGMVTCNFDGKAHHRTTIGEGAFIGSGTMLVAPVEVGAGAMIGAGAVVTRDIPPRTLAFGVPAQVKRKLEL